MWPPVHPTGDPALVHGPVIASSASIVALPAYRVTSVASAIT
jgi:hypothetical protein